MSIQHVAKEVRFPYRQWSAQGNTIKPVKGSWTLPPFKLKSAFQHPEKVKALISCPQCNQATILLEEQLTVAPTLHEAVANNMQCGACHFYCTATLQDFDRRKLYCVAFEVTTSDGTVKGIKEYFHGLNEADVRVQFYNGHIHDKIDQIVAIGQVVGLFVDDNQGKLLHV